jgi:hypothetical protein
MKKVFVLAFVFLFVIPTFSYAKDYAGYALIGGGGGGDAKAGNAKIEFGGYSINKNTNILLGLGFTSTFNRDELPSDTLSYPCPHTNYRTLGTKNKKEEVGLYGKVGIEPVKTSSIFLFVTGGATWGKEVDLVRSNVTGWYYEQSEKTKTYGLIGGGIGYFPDPKNKRFVLQVEYNNRMGIVGGIGINW